MVTKTKPAVTTPPKGKTDWGTPLIIVGGAAACGLGLWLFLRKKAFATGDKIDCLFKFEHAGLGEDFIFRVVMGHTFDILGLPVFDEMPETRQEFVNPIPPSVDFQKKEIKVTYQVPDVLAPDKYDVEASIRWPDGSIVRGMRVIANDIVVVE